MAILETPREITPIHRKGIEMAVRGLHKRFPFIIGYKDDTSIDQYNYAQYIDLIVDVEKLSEYTKRDINPHWDRELRIKNDFLTYALWSCLEYDEDLNDIHNHPGYQLGKEVSDLLSTIYDYLPEQYKMTYEVNYDWRPEPAIHPVELKVNAYIHRLT